MKKSFLVASTSLLAMVTATVAYADPQTVSIYATPDVTNQAYIVQGIPGLGSNHNDATIDQGGLGNKVGNLTGTVTLTGDPTGLSLSKNIGLSVFKQGGDYNTLKVDQSGQSNEVLTTSVFTAASQETGSYQSGERNTGNITQTGNYGKALLQQQGSYNTGTITQYGGDTKFAAIYQLGNNEHNEASILQQNGKNQYAVVVQTGGDHNTATVQQYGIGNVAGLLQSGNYNDATVYQTGTGVAAIGLQFGDRNTASVSQTAGSANAAYAQLGTYNTVTIRQK